MLDRNKVTAVGRSSYCFGLFYFGVDSISEEVLGFSPFMVSPRKKHCVHCLLCLIVVLVVLSVKDSNIMLD